MIPQHKQHQSEFLSFESIINIFKLLKKKRELKKHC